MKKKKTFIALAIIICGCSPGHEADKIVGTWEGSQIYTYEEAIIDEPAKSLEDKLGRIITSYETVANGMAFRFEGDSAWITRDSMVVGFFLIPDEENEKRFLLVGNPTLSLTITKNTEDSLILEEQIVPVNFTLSTGKIVSSQRKVVKSSFILRKSRTAK